MVLHANSLVEGNRGRDRRKREMKKLEDIVYTEKQDENEAIEEIIELK
jgi:hypothetical protein